MEVMLDAQEVEDHQEVVTMGTMAEALQDTMEEAFLVEDHQEVASQVGDRQEVASQVGDRQEVAFQEEDRQDHPMALQVRMACLIITWEIGMHKRVVVPPRKPM